MSLPFSSSIPLVSFLCIALAPLHSAEAATIVSHVDHFLDASIPSTGSPGPQVWNRGIDLDIISNPNNQAVTAQVSTAGNGLFFLDGGPGAVFTIELNYDTITGGSDLTAGGANSLILGVLLADVTGDFTTTITDSLGNSASRSLTTTAAIQNLTDLEFDFASFSGPSSVNFTDVTNIDIAYVPSRDGADLVIDYASLGQVTPVPEPGSTALVLMSSLLLATRRRRR